MIAGGGDLVRPWAAALGSALGRVETLDPKAYGTANELVALAVRRDAEKILLEEIGAAVTAARRLDSATDGLDDVAGGLEHPGGGDAAGNVGQETEPAAESLPAASGLSGEASSHSGADRSWGRGHLAGVDENDRDAGADAQLVDGATVLGDGDEAVAYLRDALRQGREVLVITQPDLVAGVKQLLQGHDGLGSSSGETSKVGRGGCSPAPAPAAGAMPVSLEATLGCVGEHLAAAEELLRYATHGGPSLTACAGTSRSGRCVECSRRSAPPAGSASTAAPAARPASTDRSPDGPGYSSDCCATCGTQQLSSSPCSCTPPSSSDETSKVGRGGCSPVPAAPCTPCGGAR